MFGNRTNLFGNAVIVGN